MAKLHRTWSSYALLSALAAAALAGFVYLARFRLHTKSEEIQLELAKACLGVLVAAVAGTVLKTITDRTRTILKEEARQRVFKQHMLADLKAVHDAMETARTLIEAHRSAKSYGEQIRRLGRSRVRLQAVERAILADNIDFQVAREGLLGCVAHMVRYIRSLEDEYHEKYLEASRMQRVDEEANKDLAAKAGKSGVQPEPHQWRVEAWTYIDTHFGALKDLRSAGKSYQKQFRGPLDAATVELRSQIAGRTSGDDLKQYRSNANQAAT